MWVDKIYSSVLVKVMLLLFEYFKLYYHDIVKLLVLVVDNILYKKILYDAGFIIIYW